MKEFVSTERQKQRRARRPLAVRFHEKVDIRTQDECWQWLGASRSAGGGMISYLGKPRSAARISWLLVFGFEPPEDLDLCHSCDNPTCVNPNHLWIGTRSDNMKDSREKGRLKMPCERGYPNSCSMQTHCKHGHPFDKSNTSLRRHNGRRCRTCNRLASRKHRLKHRKI